MLSLLLKELLVSVPKLDLDFFFAVTSHDVVGLILDDRAGAK